MKEKTIYGNYATEPEKKQPNLHANLPKAGWVNLNRFWEQTDKQSKIAFNI